MSAVVFISWFPIFFVLLSELISNEKSPEWADTIGYIMAGLDVAFFTPITLIRFNKEYRRCWYDHVVPRRWTRNRLFTGIYCKSPQEVDEDIIPRQPSGT